MPDLRLISCVYRILVDDISILRKKFWTGVVGLSGSWVLDSRYDCLGDYICSGFF